MKPSERINQILEERYAGKENKILYLPVAIEQYLDEEYEKKKPCKHKNSYQVDA